MADRFDVVIRGARIVDGTGNPWRYGDVALAGDRVAAVSQPGSLNGAEVVDAEGMIVAPGFIDIHSGSIVSLMRDGRSLSKVTQGVTTEIMGEKWTPAPCGGRTGEDNSLGFMRTFPELEPWRERMTKWRRFGDWLDAMVEHGVSPNIGSFVGGGTVRSLVKGMDEGEATPDELEAMRAVVDDAMEDGAFGVAYALIYPPDAFVGTDELVGVCEAVARRGGVYITHMRSEADEFLEALEETLEIGRRTGVSVEIYHLKVCGKANWPKMTEAIARIDAARASGLDVTSSMYPYIAGGTGLSSIFPPTFAAGGKFYENLRDPATAARMKEEVHHPSGGWEPLGNLAGPEGVYPVGLHAPQTRQYIGKSLAEIAALMGKDWVDVAIDLLVAEQQRIGTVYFLMSEENLKLQLRQPWIKLGTDAGGVDPAWAEPQGPTHPRAYGTYTRVLGKYVREEKVLTMEDAIRKMTSSVAARLSIPDRGVLREGYLADVVVFDPETVGDRSTFEDSHRLSTGIRDVWINGARVIANGEHTGAKPGRIVRGPGWK